jgi:hypothetical protein
MSKGTRGMNKAARLCAAVCVAAALVAAPVSGVLAHGSFQAHARQPAFDRSALQLVGSGGYATERRHQQIRVTVCLRKRYGDRFFAVRCMTDYDSDRRVRAQVSVPGCVEGVWRTTALGEALGRGGEWTHAAFDASPRFTCPAGRN